MSINKLYIFIYKFVVKTRKQTNIKINKQNKFHKVTMTSLSRYKYSYDLKIYEVNVVETRRILHL